MGVSKMRGSRTKAPRASERRPRRRSVRPSHAASRATARGKRAPARGAEVERATRETQVRVTLDIDGTGTSSIETGVPFLNHMLEIFARHGLFDVTVVATGDLDVDAHHTVEDVGLTIGQSFREALGEKAGIRRFGEATVPLDEALVNVVVDLSGRPYLVYEVALGQTRIGSFDPELVHDYLQAFVTQVGMNLHVTCVRGRNPHHIVEATFKGIARALDAATQLDPRVKGVPSTKGTL
jgi:imidazoleglycerol-phosphate dehydratase